MPYLSSDPFPTEESRSGNEVLAIVSQPKRLHELVGQNILDQSQAIALAERAAVLAGIPLIEARKTIRSAMRGQS